MNPSKSILPLLRSIVRVIFTGGLTWILLSCGLPSLAESELEPSRPEVSGFYNGSSIEIDISGSYPIEQFPNFNGFNIYYAENNEQTNIYKRVLYVDDRTRLPSVRVNALNQESDITRLSTQFRFRLTETSTDEDLEDEITDTASRIDGDTFLRNIRPYDRFYFIVRPFNDFMEYDRSETLRIFIPEVNNNRRILVNDQPDPDPLTDTVDTNISLATLTSPREEGLGNTNVFSFTLTADLASNTITIQPNSDTVLGGFFSAQTRRTGCYENISFPETFPNATSAPLPLAPSGAYYFTNTFTSGNTNFSDYQYRLFVEEINGTEIIVCTAYER